jgi:tetratricopeptide (TPR) repeat protein
MTDHLDNPVNKMIHEVRTKLRRDLYSGQLDYKNAVQTLKRYIEIAQQMENWILVGQLYETIGTIELERGNYQKCLELYQLSLDYFHDADDMGRSGVMLSNIGEVYRRQGRTDEAADHFTRAREVAVDAGRVTLEITTYNNEGQTWVSAGEVERGIKLIEIGLEKAHHADWDREIASDAIPEMRSGLAQAYAHKGDFEKAWEHVKLGFNLAKEYDQMQQMAYGYLSMAIIAQLDPNSQDDPAEYFRLSREHYEKISANAALGKMLIHEGNYWRDQGEKDRAQEAYREAVTRLEESGLYGEAEAVRDKLVANY